MKKLKHILVLLGLMAFGLLSNPLNAQISEGGTPPSFAYPALKAQSDARSSFLVQPGFDIKAQIVQDRKEQEESMNARPLRMGKNILLNEAKGGVDLIRDGEKTVLADGTVIWRITIKSPGALALGLTYSKFVIPKGGKLFIYSPIDKENQLIGAFTEKNSVAKGAMFATELILGDEVVLEYVSPVKAGAGLAVSEDVLPQINISSLVYAYNYITGAYRLQDNSDIGASNSCMVNINCSPEGDDWQDEKKGVAKIIYPRGTGWYLCSGSIMNNTAQDLTPYYLTAFHCIDGMTAAELDQMIFYFHFESPTCTYGGTPPTTTKTLVGAELKASSSIYGGNGSDGALLELRNDIPLDYDVYYNGWDRTNPTTAFDGVGIHHPGGDLKKISTFEGATSNPNSINWQGGGNTPANAHWRAPFVQTNGGTRGGGTEGGSSGSPLFNSAGLVVGTLSGGGTACAPGTSYYGKLWYHWDQGSAESLEPYLDPLSTGQTTISGTYVQQTTPTAAFNASSTSIYALESITYTDRSSLATTWEWTFEGGIPNGFEGKEPPVVTYNTPGTYTTSLTINKGTSDEDVVTKTITVTLKGGTPSSPIANFSLTDGSVLKEGFDKNVSTVDIAANYPGWTVTKPGASANQWKLGKSSNVDFGDIDPTSTYSVLVPYDINNVIDTWLISPTVTVPAGAQLDFYPAYSSYYMPQLTFHVIVGGSTSAELYSNQYESGETFDMSWRGKQTVDLSAYAGQDVQLAWRYYGATNLLVLDGIRLYVDPDPSIKLTIKVGDYISPVNLSTGPPVLYEWALDGGIPATSDKEEPGRVQYMTPGVYDVSLWVKNTEGENTRILAGAVTVEADPPVLAYEVSGGYTNRDNWSLFIPTGAELEFTDKSENIPTSWEWTFGGGGTPNVSNEQNPIIQFNTEGLFDFSVKVENDAASDEFIHTDGIKVGYTRDTIWNMDYNEVGEAIYSYTYGYITGTNSWMVTSFAEQYDAPLAPAAITGVKLNILAVGQTSAHKLLVGIAKAGSDGLPGSLIATTSLPATAINQTSVTDNNPTYVEFDTPVSINEPFFVIVGDPDRAQGAFYSPGYTAAIVSTQSRGADGKNTSYWYDYYFDEWYDLSGEFTDFSISMDVAPVLTYAKYEGVDVNKLNYKNIDPTAAAVNVKANIPWVATTDAAWINIDNGAADGDGSFTVSVNDNNFNFRRALVTVYAGEDNIDYILVQQAGVNPIELTAAVADEDAGEIALAWDHIVKSPYALGDDIFEDVESHSAWAINSPGDYGWQYIDGDGSNVYKITNASEDYPNPNNPASFRVYTPSKATPAITADAFTPKSGKQYFVATACLGGVTNNDWLISPEVKYPSDFKFSFWARSLNSNYGLERMKVAYSTTGTAEADFTVITTGSYVQVPTAWTKYEYTIPSNAKYVAINCVSNDAMMLMVDDIFIGLGEAPASTYENAADLELTNIEGGVKIAPIENQATAISEAERQAMKELRESSIGKTMILKNENTGEELEVTVKAPERNATSTRKFEAVATNNATQLQQGSTDANTLESDQALPIVKLRYDDGANVNAIQLNTPDDTQMEVAIRFSAVEQIKYQGAKMKAVDVFLVKVPSDGIILKIRQGEDVIHSQVASALIANEWIRIALTEELYLDASKDLYVGYEYVQRDGEAVPGVGQGPGTPWKSDLISVEGDPFESLYALNSGLNYNWNIALLIEDNSDVVDIAYNVYRNEELVTTVNEKQAIDMLGSTTKACYVVTALYNDEVESTNSNISCVTLKALLQVIADDISRYVGQPNPELTFSITGDFAEGDTEATMKPLFTISTPATIDSEVGDYPIELSAAAHDKYRFAYHNGTLTVKAIPALNEAPTLTASIANDVNVALQWTAVTDAVSYNVYREGVQIATVSGTTHTDNALTPGREYCYTVKGISSMGAESDMSNVACATVRTPLNPESNAFTPFDKDGINDVFMKGARIEVVNRYGQSIFNGRDGWDGTRSNGQLVAPGTYYYKAVLPDGRVLRGSVEAIKK